MDGICAIGLFFYRKAVFLDASLAIGSQVHNCSQLDTNVRIQYFHVAYIGSMTEGWTILLQEKIMTEQSLYLGKDYNMDWCLKS